MLWKKQRNEALLKRDYSGDPVIEEDIDEMSDELLARTNCTKIVISYK